MRSSSKNASACAWAVLAALLLAAAGAPCAEPAGAPDEPEAPKVLLSEAERARLGELFEGLRLAFLARDSGAVVRLFIARSPEEQARLEVVSANIKRELHKERYQQGDGFEIEYEPEAHVPPVRYSVWVRLTYRLFDKPGYPPRQGTHNDFFLVERLPDGAFAIVDSPYFDTLGQRQGLNLVADALLIVIALLAALSFWVWMGFEAFSMRPRNHAWRTFVMIPGIGALAYFVFCYLPAFRRKPAPAEA
ncbi:MAG: hypothetical protein KIS92_00600 [Planctomycetota bacterium]|nr:hypothetical protein [Planctomycetota bacterium]